MKLVGIEEIDYENKEGRRIVGTKLHCTYESEKVEGYATLGPIYCGEKVDCSALNIGDEIEVFYNNFKKPVFVQKLS